MAEVKTTGVITTLSRLVIREPLPGQDAGTCYICGEDTDSGHAGPPSDRFTAWAACTAGAVVCGYCWAMLKDQRFRSRSWVATLEGVNFELSRADLRRALVEPPEPPFAVYVTFGGKKQGWLSLMRRVSTSRRWYWIGTDIWDFPVPADVTAVRRFTDLVDELRSRDVPRWLLQADPSVLPRNHRLVHLKTIERAAREGWLERLEIARRERGNPLWEVVVRVSE